MKQVFRRLPPVCALDSHSRTGQTPLGVEYQTAIEQGAQWDADAAIVSTWHWIRGSMAGVVCLFVCFFLSLYLWLVGSLVVLFLVLHFLSLWYVFFSNEQGKRLTMTSAPKMQYDHITWDIFIATSSRWLGIPPKRWWKVREYPFKMLLVIIIWPDIYYVKLVYKWCSWYGQNHGLPTPIKTTPTKK